VPVGRIMKSLPADLIAGRLVYCNVSNRINVE
jgi:hypothetical protein